MRKILLALLVLLGAASAADAARKSGDEIFEPGKVVAADFFDEKWGVK